MSAPRFPHATGYAFDWNSDPELNNPKYNTPRPCPMGANCCYAGACSGVHPGEEGTGRKLFAADPARGYDMPQVRLIGHARFYERRRLRISWPAWCERQGLPAPNPDAPKVVPQVIREKAAPNGRRREVINLVPTPAAGEPGSPENPIQASLVPFALPLPLDLVMEIASRPMTDGKERLGEFIYAMLERVMAEPGVMDGVTENGLWKPTMTPGKITGMLLDGCEVEELERILYDHDALSDYVADAVMVLAGVE